MTRTISAKLLLALVPAATLFATSAWADSCTPVTSASCADGTSCTTLTGSYTNTTGKKIKQAEIVALSGEDRKQLAAVWVVFTGTTTTLYDPNSNTPPSGLGSATARPTRSRRRIRWRRWIRRRPARSSRSGELR